MGNEMSDETLETREDYRVVLAIHEQPEAPYNDGGFPVIQMPHVPGYRGNNVAQLTELTSYILPASLVEAAAKWHHEPDTLERFARIFYGATSFAWADDIDRDASYIALNPADWRESVGVDADNPAELDEVRAWLTGEVYGYEIQVRVNWSPNVDGFDPKETWETIDSLWGLYGREYARETALEAFNRHPDVPAED